MSTSRRLNQRARKLSKDQNISYQAALKQLLVQHTTPSLREVAVVGELSDALAGTVEWLDWVRKPSQRTRGGHSVPLLLREANLFDLQTYAKHHKMRMLSVHADSFDDDSNSPEKYIAEFINTFAWVVDGSKTHRNEDKTDFSVEYSDDEQGILVLRDFAAWPEELQLRFAELVSEYGWTYLGWQMPQNWLIVATGSGDLPDLFQDRFWVVGSKNTQIITPRTIRYIEALQSAAAPEVVRQHIQGVTGQSLK